jgi:pimeloyl-ACP methyl ester carboxylesterase
MIKDERSRSSSTGPLTAVIIVLLLTLAMTVCGLLRPLKQRLYFYPEVVTSAAQRPAGYRGMEAFEFTLPLASASASTATGSGGGHPAGQLHGWLVTARGVGARSREARAGTQLVVFMHGNSGNIGHLRGFINEFRHEQPHADLCLFDYTGYGESRASVAATGTVNDASTTQASGAVSAPSEATMHADAAAVVQWLLNDLGYSINNTTFWGYSMGGAVAAFAAARFQPPRLVLQATFSSIRAVAQHSLPKVLALFSWLCNGDFEAQRALRDYRGRILIMHARGDELIPLHVAKTMARDLQEHTRKASGSAGPASVAFVVTEGTHNHHLTDWDTVRTWTVGDTTPTT